MVRLYKDIPARRDPRTGELHASKLQLKNKVYRVISHAGFVYNIECRESGRMRTAHVSQIARFFEAPRDEFVRERDPRDKAKVKAKPRPHVPLAKKSPPPRQPDKEQNQKFPNGAMKRFILRY